MHSVFCTLHSPCYHVTYDSLSCGFYSLYQIVFTLSNIIIEFSRVNSINLHTFGGINPNFRVGQLSILVKIKVVLFMCFELIYIIEKN